MAFVTLEDFNGGKVDLNPALVQAVTSFQHFDHDMALPEDWFEPGPNGPELKAEHQEEADILRTSPRTIVSFNGGQSFVVKGSVEAVKKVLGT